MAEENSESKIRKAQPKQGLETNSLEGARGGLETNSLEGARGGLGPAKPVGAAATDPAKANEEAELQVANAFAPDLSGSNGALAQFRAVREIASTVSKGHFRSMVVSSANGAAFSGSFPFFSLNGGSSGRRGPAFRPEFALPPLQFKLNSFRSRVKINAGTIYILGQDHYMEEAELSAGDGDDIFINFQLVPDGRNYGSVGSPDYMVSGFESIVGSPEFKTNADTQLAEVDPATGTVVRNGKFSIHLGRIGATSQQRYGPLSVTSCGESPFLSVNGPVYVFYDPSNF